MQLTPLSSQKKQKLVRDKIPEIIKQSNREPKTRILKGEELLDALNQKLVEEHQEYLVDGEVSELADMLEVIFAIAKFKGTSKAELIKLAEDKVKKAGAFEDGVFLIDVEESNEPK